MSFSSSDITARIVGLAPVGPRSRSDVLTTCPIEACLLDLLVGDSCRASQCAERMCLWSPTEQLIMRHVPDDTEEVSSPFCLTHFRDDLLHRPFLERFDVEPEKTMGCDVPALIVPLDARVERWLDLPAGTYDRTHVLRFDRLMRALFSNLMEGERDYYRVWQLYDPGTSAPYHPSSLIHDVFVAGRILAGVLSELPLAEILASAR